MDVPVRLCTSDRGISPARDAQTSLETAHDKSWERDELVVSKFSNAVRGLRELAALIELCRIKVVRIISIHDKIDSRGELFPDTTAAEVLTMFGSLPEEVAVLRKSSDRVIRLQQSISVPVKTSKMLSKTERDKIAVDMYNNGYSVNEIMAHCNVKSKSTVYQILGSTMWHSAGNLAAYLEIGNRKSRQPMPY